MPSFSLAISRIGRILAACEISMSDFGLADAARAGMVRPSASLELDFCYEPRTCADIEVGGLAPTFAGGDLARRRQA